MITDPVFDEDKAHLSRVVRGAQPAGVGGLGFDNGSTWRGGCAQPNEIPVLGLRLSQTLSPTLGRSAP